VGSYSYSTVAGRTNGNWNNEVGYGCLNAFAAIQSVYPTITGPSLVCTSGSTYTLNNLPSSDSVLWSCSSNLSYISASGVTAVFEANGSGSGQIWATIVSPECGNTTITLNVMASPGPISIDFDSPPGRFTAMIDGVPTATSYKWYCDGVLNSSTSTIARFTRQTDNCEHVYYVDVIAVVNTTCESSLRHAEVSEPPCNYYSIFPNPASFEISITQNTLTTTSAQSIKKPIKEVRIIDKFGRQALTQSFGDEVYEIKLNISNLQTGSYTIQINQGTDMEAYSVIKE